MFTIVLMAALMGADVRGVPMCIADVGEEALCCSGRKGKDDLCVTLDSVSPEFFVGFDLVCRNDGGSTTVEVVAECSPEDPGQVSMPLGK